MSKRDISQNIKAKIRREIQSELRTAIEMGVTKGSVVVSTGDCMLITITYHEVTLIDGTVKKWQRVHFKGYNCNVNDAASAMLYEWEYTR